MALAVRLPASTFESTARLHRFGAAANHCAIYGAVGDQDKVALGSAAKTIAATVKFNVNNNVILHLILGSSGKLSVLSSLCG